MIDKQVDVHAQYNIRQRQFTIHFTPCFFLLFYSTSGFQSIIKDSVKELACGLHQHKNNARERTMSRTLEMVKIEDNQVKLEDAIRRPTFWVAKEWKKETE